MKIGYYKVGNVRKPDGSDFNICGFNDKKAEIALSKVSGYARSNFVEVRAQDGTPYYIPAGLENSETQSGASRLKIGSNDKTLEVLDWKSAYDSVCQSSLLTLQGMQKCKQTSVSLGYGKYRYTNTYTFRIQVYVQGPLSWSDWIDMLWPSGHATVRFTRNKDVLIEWFDKNTTETTLSGYSSFVETNTTGDIHSIYPASLYLYPELDITSPTTGNKVQMSVTFGKSNTGSSYTKSLRYMTGNTN